MKMTMIVTAPQRIRTKSTIGGEHQTASPRLILILCRFLFIKPQDVVHVHSSKTYVSNLEFYLFVESSLCESARSIKPSIKNASEATMIENVTSMINHLGDMETY